MVIFLSASILYGLSFNLNELNQRRARQTNVYTKFQRHSNQLSVRRALPCEKTRIRFTKSCRSHESIKIDDKEEIAEGPQQGSEISGHVHAGLSKPLMDFFATLMTFVILVVTPMSSLATSDPIPRLEGYESSESTVIADIDPVALPSTPSTLSTPPLTVSPSFSIIDGLTTNTRGYTTSTSTSNPRSAVPVIDILRDRYAQIRSLVTSEKVGQLRVGDALVTRLKAVDTELEYVQEDIFRDPVDWEVLAVAPKVFRAFAPLFTAYTDRAFPTSDPIDVSLRYALRYEVGAFFTGVKELEDAIQSQKIRNAQRAFAKMSLSYDRFLKAGDLYAEGGDEASLSLLSVRDSIESDSKLSYIAPSIEAPGLTDEILLLRGPDKGRKGTVLWISKGVGTNADKVIVKLEAVPGVSAKEVKSYPYSLVAKTTPPEIQFQDDLISAYVASAISSGIMYPIDSFKTRRQSGQPGIPTPEEGGFWGLWKGVNYFIADANDAIYLACYGYIKPFFLGLIDVTNPATVFSVLTLSGSLGDAVGSIFRVPMEITYKQIQTGTSNDGFKILGSLVAPTSRRLVILSWVAILCRDMPFAGLQIALFDVFKNLFAFLDDAGVSIYVQRALWGAFAGGTAAVITTPFDLITTNVINLAFSNTDDSPNTPPSTTSSPLSPSSLEVSSASFSRSTQSTQPNTSNNASTDASDIGKTLREIGPLFVNSFKSVLEKDGVGGLFSGAIPRFLFFSPAAMIFFGCYGTFLELIEAYHNGKLWFQN